LRIPRVERKSFMKKFAAVLLAVLILGAVFVACTKSNEDTTAEAPVPISDSIDEAVLNGEQARTFIKTQYTYKELGIDEDATNIDFSYNESAYEYKGDKFILIKAMTFERNPDVTTPDGEATYSTTIVGEYLVSYDAEKVLMKDKKTGEFKEMENRYEDYRAKGETVASTEAE